MRACLSQKILPLTLCFAAGVALAGAGKFAWPSKSRIKHKPAATSRIKCEPAATTQTRSRTWLFIREQPLPSPLPFYSEEAQKDRELGSVRMRILLGADGSVKEVRPQSSTLPERFLPEVTGAAARVRFTPPTEDGRPLPVWVETTCHYNHIAKGHRNYYGSFCRRLELVSVVGASEAEGWRVIYE